MKKTSVEINIKIEFGDISFECTEDEARQLMDQIKQKLPEKGPPVFVPWPVPTYPVSPDYPIITYTNETNAPWAQWE